MFCGNCGSQIPAGVKFCSGCGTPAGATAASAASAPLAKASTVRSEMLAAAPSAPMVAAVGGVHLIHGIEHRINKLAGTEELEGFSLKQMFSEVFKKRTEDELDDYFLAGTARTTPRIQDVQCGWPHPWFFMRVMFLVMTSYAILAIAFSQTNNPNLVPGLIVMGAFAMPLSVLFLFYELNTPRNVPFHGVLSMFCLGGVVSLFITILVVDPMLGMLNWMGASSAGITEETSKLLTVILLVRRRKSNYILNGLVFGAAVGAGFGAFESAGYAFRAALQDVSAMNVSILMRAALAPFMHVAWTAIAAAALWRSKGDQPLGIKSFDFRFWKTLLIPMTLHIIWNSPFQLPFFGTQVIVGLVGWYVVFGLTQQGLRQVRDAQLAASHVELATAHEMAAAQAS